MKHYIDITLLPSDDIDIHFLWTKVMMQIHLAFVEMQNEVQKIPAAISFPNYRCEVGEKKAFLGNKVRLLAPDKSDLEKLNIGRWLNRLTDYVHIKAIADVPNDVSEYECFSRRVKAGSPDKHIRRRMKRKNETEEEAAEFFADYKVAEADKQLPFIHMKSLSGDQSFRLVIQRKTVGAAPNCNAYSTYGLSAEGVLPKF
jgi:CRISPR-associated endonuclease Csy4